MRTPLLGETMTRNLAGTNIPPGNGGVVFPSPNEWPVTIHAITGITQSANPIVTAVDHGITISTSQSTPKVDFTQVKGMTQINGKFAFVTSVINSSQFTIALDTSQYSTYTSGGFVNVTISPSPIDPLTNTYA